MNRGSDVRGGCMSGGCVGMGCGDRTCVGRGLALGIACSCFFAVCAQALMTAKRALSFAHLLDCSSAP